MIEKQTQNSLRLVIRFFQRIAAEVAEENREVECLFPYKIIHHAETNMRRYYMQANTVGDCEEYRVSFNQHESINVFVSVTGEVWEFGDGFLFDIKENGEELFRALIACMVVTASIKGIRCIYCKSEKGNYTGGYDEELVKQVLREAGFTVSDFNDSLFSASRILEPLTLPEVIDILSEDIRHGYSNGAIYYVARDEVNTGCYAYTLAQENQYIKTTVTLNDNCIVFNEGIEIKTGNPQLLSALMEWVVLDGLQMGVTRFEGQTISVVNDEWMNRALDSVGFTMNDENDPINFSLQIL